jgi:small subunit ribosomal protein S2
MFHMPEEPLVYPSEASREMIDAGVFYGRKKSKTNPKMRQFVLANRGGVEIINLQKTGDALDGALGFIKEKMRGNCLALFVGTEPAAEVAIVRLAKKFNFPYVTFRWVGGAITNFKIIAKRIEYLKKLRSDFASRVLEKYTKKERLELEREMKRLEELMGGLENLSREPDLLVMVDPIMHHTALREARRKKIPVVAFANVDADPDDVDYLVPGNDKAKKSIEWFFEKVEKAMDEGVAMRAAMPPPPALQEAAVPADATVSQTAAPASVAEAASQQEPPKPEGVSV